MTSALISTDPVAESARQDSSSESRTDRTGDKVRVLMLDLLPTVPYYTGHLCSALGNIEGLEVSLASATYPHDHEFLKQEGVIRCQELTDVSYRVRPPFVRRALKLPEYLLNLSKIARRPAPDVLHIQFLPLLEHGFDAEVKFLRRQRERGAMIVYTAHNIVPHDSGASKLATYRRLYRMIDKFICHDNASKHRLISDFEVEPSRIAIIPHGPLFAAPVAPLNRPEGLPVNVPIVLFQGIIRPYKGVLFLLKAWKAAMDAGCKAVLAIVGTGDAATIRAIRDEVRRLGIASSVHLDFRFVSVEEMAAYHGAADVLVYPYSDITGSGALMTGIGRGKAIIASDLVGFRDTLQHGENALLVPYGDVDGWSRTLHLLVSDYGLRNRLAARLALSREQASNWDDIARRTCDLYREACVKSSSVHV